MINSNSPYDNTLLDNNNKIKINSDKGFSSISSDILSSSSSVQENILDDTKYNNLDDIKDETKELMKKDFTHPKHDDPNIQYKLFKKREYYYNKIPARPLINENTSYETIKQYRDDICGSDFTLHSHQGMLSNFINPETPYRGVLIFHGLGTGKCVSKDTQILVNNNYINIEDLWNQAISPIFYDNNNGEWKEQNNDLYVESFNYTDIFVSKKIIRLYREKINSYVYEIILNNNKSIILTYNHKLYVKHDNIYEWTNIFKINDEICVYNITPEYAKIIRINIHHYNDYVYDVEIEDTHNYIANGILCHNTCVGVAIAEKFKQLVQKYNTKIHILVPGLFLKNNWKKHIIKCTNNTYKNKEDDKYSYQDEDEKERQLKQAYANASQYYKIMSYRSFYKRVSGDKIIEKNLDKTEKGRTVYRKTNDGEFERDYAIDRIYNLNNSLIIVDEAHNLTGNEQGAALEKIIRNSVNLKVVLMTGTPMKNLGSDIVDLINFLRPADSPMLKEKIFTTHKNYELDLKEGGLEYFKNMINGYVSHVRGGDPLTFAKRIDRGSIPKGLLFTNLNGYNMSSFQQELYNLTTHESDDALDRSISAVANMAYPGLTKNKDNIEGYYGIEGMNYVKDQIKISGDLLNKKINEKFFKNKYKNHELITLSKDGKNITGKILEIPHLKIFSIKFYKCLKKLSRLVVGKKGVKTAFIYSNLVRIGIDLFQEILLQNGYLMYQEDTENYVYENNTICYFCGKTYESHKSQTTHKGGDPKNDEFSTDSESESESDQESDQENESEFSETSTEYTPRQMDKLGIIPKHKFKPATFLTITGKENEGENEEISDDKKRILDDIFNKLENKDGRNIKFVLGSIVINEGVSLQNIGEVHILDAYWNLGRVDQVVGRGIRWCSHYKLMNEDNLYPYVNVYKYVITLQNDKLSTEEELYRKAEQKYILINKLERAMKERALDCPLNVSGNMFNEEIEKYNTCELHKDAKIKCPSICNFTKCDYKCDDPKLNFEYYDPKRKLYKAISKDKIDYTTFTPELAQYEIEYAKKKIKNLYIGNNVFTLNEIIEYVKNTYDEEKRKLFDDFFVYKALDDFVPITENDFNNFKDVILDKNNIAGYLIYRDIYYIFQPFNENENVPLYYRTNTLHLNFSLTLHNYLKSLPKYKFMKETKNTENEKDITAYNFNDTVEYYDERPENNVVGIIDKELDRKNNKNADDIQEVFKIRNKLPKNSTKKRGTGIPSIKGSVCYNSKTKDYLDKLAKSFDIKTTNDMNRTDICNLIQDKMLEKEKYSKGKDKLTYVRIPANHPKYPFPYNLEDRVKYIIDKIKAHSKNILEFNIKEDTKNKLPVYYINIKTNKDDEHDIEIFLKYGAVKNKNIWSILVE